MRRLLLLQVLEDGETVTVAVKVSRLGKTFVGEGGYEVHALVDVSLDLYQNQITALLGQNGAGKSTAINILIGSEQPTRGHGHVFGHSIRSSIEKARRERNGGVTAV